MLREVFVTEKVDLRPYLNKAGELALKAVRDDDWMTPSIEDGDNLKEYDQFAGNHRSQWESTDHFAHFYSSALWTIVDSVGYYVDEEIRNSVYEDLLSEFWDTWENEIDLYTFWTKEGGTEGES